jgi:hypothetical protein
MPRLIRDSNASEIAYKALQDEMVKIYGGLNDLKQEWIKKIIDLHFDTFGTECNTLRNNRLNCTSFVCVSAYTPRESFDGYRAHSYDSEGNDDYDAFKC